MINLTIGVIIYNVQKYLHHCLDSVIPQKGDDIEIILVDDGSTDKSGKICDEYAKRDHRIKVIHQSNVGLGLARNTIIVNARGKWITFVDGDDSLFHYAVDNLRHYFNSNNDVIVYLEKNACSGKDITFVKPTIITDVRSYQADIHRGIPPYNLITTWGKLFRTDFLSNNNLLFPDLRRAEDFIFTIEYLYYVNSILLVPLIIYEYNLNEGSVSVKYNPNILNIIDLVMKTLYSIIKSYSPQDKKMLDIFYREGLLEISYILDLSIYNARCNWKKHKRIAFLKDMLELGWVKDLLLHGEYHPDNKGIVSLFCKYGKDNDLISLDKECIKIRRRRQYWLINSTLRKVPIFAAIMDFLKFRK